MENNSTLYYFQGLYNRFGHYGGVSLERVNTHTHTHTDFYETILVLTGKWEHIIGDSSYIMPAGTLLLLRPGVTHLLSVAMPDSIHFVLCVEKTYFQDYAARVFPSFIPDSSAEYMSIQLSASKMRYIEDISKHLIGASTTKAEWIADEVLFLYLSAFANQKNTFECNHYISDIVSKIDNQLYMNDSVDAICSHYPYSRSLLLKQFKELTGYTMVEYKTKQKMKYACDVLVKTGCRISDIAYLLHYESISYFVRAFKKEIGCSPSEYRTRERSKTHTAQ